MIQFIRILCVQGARPQDGNRTSRSNALSQQGVIWGIYSQSLIVWEQTAKNTGILFYPIFSSPGASRRPTSQGFHCVGPQSGLNVTVPHTL